MYPLAICVVFCAFTVFFSVFCAPKKRTVNYCSIGQHLDFLERQLNQVQNFQKVTPIVLSPSSISAKEDFFNSKKEEIFARLKSIIEIFNPSLTILMDQYPESAAHFLTELAMKCDWGLKKIEISSMDSFMRRHVYFLPNFCINEKQLKSSPIPLISLNCGHRVCFKCVVFGNFERICLPLNSFYCSACLKTSCFDADSYCKQFADSPSGVKNTLIKVQTKGFLYTSKETCYKKCPKLSCDQIMKIQQRPNSLRFLWSKRETCPNLHSFCIYCSSSSEWHDSSCSLFQFILIFDGTLYFNEVFSTEISKTRLCCPKCDRYMFSINSSKIPLKVVRDFLGYASFLFCSYCLHLSVKDTKKVVPGLYNALALEQKFSQYQNSLFYKHTKLLKRLYLVVLTIVLSYHSFRFSKNYSTDYEIQNLILYAFNFDRYLRIYYESIKKCLKYRNSTNLLILERFWIEANSLLDLSIATAGSKRCRRFFTTDSGDLRVQKETLLEKSYSCENLYRELCQLICRNFYYMYKSGNSSQTFEISYDKADPRRPFVEEIENFFEENDDIRLTAEITLNRDLKEADFCRMACVSQFDFSGASHHLKANCDEYLSLCHLRVLEKCIVCLTRFAKAELIFSDCGHNLACMKCLIKSFVSCIGDQLWDNNGFLRCLDNKCKATFAPAAVLECLAVNHGAAAKVYQNMLSGKFYRAILKNENALECLNCGQLMKIAPDSQDLHDPSTDDVFISEHDLYLKTVQCPNCAKKMCFNCRQLTVHYSSHCGISTDANIASLATMCPGCKDFGVPIQDCSSVTCAECSSDFCVGCGREPFYSQFCYNLSYSERSYAAESRSILDDYFEKCASFLQPLLDDYHKSMADTTSKLKVFENSPDANIRRVAVILHAAFDFFYWHRHLLDYIVPKFGAAEFGNSGDYVIFENAASYETLDDKFVEIAKNLSFIEKKSIFCFSLLEKGNIIESVKLLHKIMAAIRKQDALVKRLKTSSRVILPLMQLLQRKEQLMIE